MLDADALRAWSRRSAEALVVACGRIDALNVFPVADRDTGTNMLATMRSAAAGAGRASGDIGAVAAALAGGSLTGARGSSGVILSRFLHGIAAGLAAESAADGASMQRALTVAAEAAYAAVSEPVEGTILSVAAAAAKAAREADPADLLGVVRAAATAARDELARTIDELPVLATAGVVDAGGQGLVVVLDALVDVVAGVDAAPEPQIAAARLVRPEAPSTFAYEVQYLLEAEADELPGLRARLQQLGDSVAVVTGGQTHNVHAHVDDVGAAIEAGIAIGKPSRITVTRFADQIMSSRVVAVCPAGDLATLFRSAGAAVIEVGEEASAVAGALTAAACETAAQSIVLLPNSRAIKELADTAAAVARANGRSVTVVPTRSPAQGLAALAVHDPTRSAGDDAIVMSAAAAATRYAEVTRARFDALTSAGECRAGDVLGLIDDDVAVIGDDIALVAREILDRMLIGGGELVTIISGADAPPSLATELADYIHATRPAVETVVHHGGQATCPLMLGVE